MGARSFPARYRRSHPGARLANQHSAPLHGSDERFADAHDAENRRHDATTGHDVHAADLLIFLLQFRSGAGIILYHAQPADGASALRQQAPARARAGQSDDARQAGEKEKMNPKGLLDTMLGYLGFVVDIAESQNEAGNRVLQ